MRVVKRALTALLRVLGLRKSLCRRFLVGILRFVRPHLDRRVAVRVGNQVAQRKGLEWQ